MYSLRAGKNVSNIVINKYKIGTDPGCFCIYNGDIHYIVDKHYTNSNSVLIFFDNYLSHDGGGNNVRGYDFTSWYGSRLYYVNKTYQNIEEPMTSSINYLFSLLKKYNNMPNVLNISFSSMELALSAIEYLFNEEEMCNYKRYVSYVGKYYGW